jgi:hypothetical protein
MYGRLRRKKRLSEKFAATPTPESPVVTGADLWREYKADCETRDVRRIDRAKLAWSHLEPVFGARPAADIRTLEIAQYIKSRRAAGMAEKFRTQIK